MTGVEYRNGGGEEIFTSFVDILKCHDILINIIPSLDMYGQKSGRSANLVHGTIGTMSC